MEENKEQPEAPKQKSTSPGIIALIIVVLLILGAGVYYAMNNGIGLFSPATKEEDVDYSMMDTERLDEETMPEPTDEAMMEDEDSMMEEDTAMEEDAMMEEGVEVVDVEGGSYYFDPNEIRVNEGDTVKIVLHSVDLMHDFVIDEFDARTDITPEGETAEVEFVADKAGEYKFYCSVGDHRARGMVGTLIVE